MCDTVAAQLVGHETHRLLPLTLLEFPKESPCRAAISTGLDEDIDQVPVLIHGAPQILALTVDRHEDLVQEPRIAESTLSSFQPSGVVEAELPAPLPHGFIRHDNAPFGQQILSISEAQTVSVVEPDGVANDVSMYMTAAVLRKSANASTSLSHQTTRRTDTKMSRRVSRRVASPACIAGVRVARPNLSARCGRTKL